MNDIESQSTAARRISSNKVHPETYPEPESDLGNKNE